LRIDLELPVETADEISVLREDAGRSDKSQTVFFTDVSLQSQYGEKSVLIDEGSNASGDNRIAALVFGIISRSIIRCYEKSEGVLSGFAGQLCRKVRIDDRPRIKRLQ